MADHPQWSEVERLVDKAKEGDDGAFRSLLQNHREAVTSTLLACGIRSPDTASDLAQDVALRAWSGLSDLRDARSFTAWIRRIAANAARDHLRRAAVRREEALEAATDLASDEDPHHDAERIAELRLMLAALEPEDAETIELLVAKAEGTTVRELAGRLDLTPEALKMRLMRARKRLRARLQRLRSDHSS